MTPRINEFDLVLPGAYCKDAARAGDGPGARPETGPAAGGPGSAMTDADRPAGAAAAQARPPQVERIETEVCGRRWVLERDGDLESLWASIGQDEFGDDERLPYWVELWPSSLVLAEWLAGRRADVAGRPCVDVGCGLGLTALVGTWLGARVAAFDYELAPLRYATRGAALNGVPQPLWLQTDWRAPGLARGAAHFVWGGDIMYELRFIEPVTAFLDHMLAPGGRAWIAEPGRNIAAPFMEHARAEGWSCERVLTRRFTHQRHPVTVHILELRREGDPAQVS